MRLGFEVVRDSIMAATAQTLAEAGLPQSVLSRTFAGIGLAGTGMAGARETLETWGHPFAGAWFEGDAYIAFLGAFGGIEGGIVVAGTGSIGIAYLDKTIRVGGYGFPVSDEGSGAHIGVNALRHALRTLDGRAEASAFSKEVLARFSNNAAMVTHWMKNARPTDYASLAPLVAKHASAGDQAAHRIMQAAGTQIADLVQGLFKHAAPRVALVGGLAAALREYMPPEVASRLVAPEADPIAGGILLAKKKQGASIAMSDPG